ncbi:MAG: hypothetical protein J6X58_06415 [Bacteroidales bacterium]|nr:hypothetical protein [Bacteroidales bacterium]
MEKRDIQLFGGKIWPWMAVGGVLAVAACITTITIPERWPGYMYYLVFFVALVFAVLAGYAAVYSHKHTEERFVDTFKRVFNRYWVYYILFVIFVTLADLVWASVFCNIYDCHGVYFLSEIVELTVVGPLEEEAMYRLLPFMTAVIPLTIVTSKRWRIVLGCLFAVMIFCVQMQFGFMHLDILNMSGRDNITMHLWIQGAAGVMFALAFGMVLYYTYRLIRARQEVPNKFKAVLLSIPAAYLASSCVHGLSNLYTVLSNLF